jgi:hypothetical protein
LFFSAARRHGPDLFVFRRVAQRHQGKPNFVKETSAQQVDLPEYEWTPSANRFRVAHQLGVVEDKGENRERQNRCVELNQRGERGCVGQEVQCQTKQNVKHGEDLSSA